MATGDTLAIFTPLAGIQPDSNWAVLEFRNRHPVLSFQDTTDESVYFEGIMPRGYGGNGVTVYLHLVSDATSGTAVMEVAFERMDGTTDLDADSFASGKTVNDTATFPSGPPRVVSVAFSDGAEMDSIAAGDAFRLRITRDADNGSDTLVFEEELLAVEIKET